MPSFLLLPDGSVICTVRDREEAEAVHLILAAIRSDCATYVVTPSDAAEVMTDAE